MFIAESIEASSSAISMRGCLPSHVSQANQYGTATTESCESSGQNSDVRVGQTPARLNGQTPAYSVAFGPFRLCPRQRLFLERDKPVRLGSRALDILIALVERPGELVTKQDLVARVWQGLVVEDGNLKVHVAALRRTLRDGKDGNRYICTVPGRGYCFVAPVVRRDVRTSNAVTERSYDAWSELASASVDDLIHALATQLSQQQFITVVGAGDMAKDMFLAAALMGHYRHGVRYIDLEVVKDPLLVPDITAAAIGLDVGSGDALADAAAFLKDKHLLLVLDNCKHVVAASTAFAASVLASAPNVRILAISR